MAELNESILKVIAYFDMFNYPVTLEEIRNFLDQPVHGEALPSAMQPLLDKQVIWQYGKFYSLKNDPLLVERRVNGNKLAVKKLKQAIKVARILSWFPYIRGIGISGSLSKNFAYKGSDFDFFIIAAANRLWIAKFFSLFVTKPLTRIGLRYLCCINYYIDEQALEIEEKNIFTAIEVATLLPVRGKHIFQCFFSSNQWVYEYLPNSCFKKLPVKELPHPLLKRGIEWLLNNKPCDSIDNWLMGCYSQHWRKQLALNILKPNGVPLGAMTTNKHFCKPTLHFQQKMLSRFQESMDHIKMQTATSFLMR